MTLSIRTCLWFDTGALDAAQFYCDLIPDSRVASVSHYPDGRVLTVEFILGGVPYQALNGGPVYPQTEATSISVTTPDQSETDRLWDALTADGGKAGQCGWLKDRWGVSWQIVPAQLPALMTGPNAPKVMEALFAMSKLDIATLEAAAKS